ncbi:MAG: CHAT domain-containing protein, partial [Pyrinomonadaceae bacterium]
PEEVTNTPEEAAIIKDHGSLIAFGNKVQACQEKKEECAEHDQLLDEQGALMRVYKEKVEELEQQVNPRLGKDKATLDPAHFKSKAKELVDARPGTVLIYPLVLEDKLWILWGATGEVLSTIQVPVRQAQLEQAVIELRRLLENPASDAARIKALGHQFYAWLLQPMEAELKANRIQHLVFALDRALRYIPMSVLFDGEHYLVEQYTLSTIVSADLTDTQDHLPAEIAQTPVLALGLSAAKAGFKPLPYVSAELDAIVQQPGIYPGMKFIDDAFNFKALRNHLHGRKILHIATHAAFVPGVKDSSFLLLGNGEKLKMTEVEELSDLGDVHLVALSACQTALGEKGQDGVEINAMSYYFLNNGVKAVLASLWAVDDSSTSQLMRTFYSELATAKVTKAQALRQAQLALLKGNAMGGSEGRGVEQTEDTVRRYDHPYYWAPFILIGNGG